MQPAISSRRKVALPGLEIGEPAGQLLSQLGRLLTGYEQMHGHTCGIGDVMLTPAADERRRRLHATADGCGVSAAESFGKLAPGALAVSL